MIKLDIFFNIAKQLAKQEVLQIKILQYLKNYSLLYS